MSNLNPSTASPNEQATFTASGFPSGGTLPALSVALNALERDQRLGRREAPLNEGLGAAAPERRADPDLRDRLAAAVDALPPGYRAVFLMHDVEGYTHEEIGAALGVRPGTSKAQLFHARAHLRRHLAAFRRPE